MIHNGAPSHVQRSREHTNAAALISRGGTATALLPRDRHRTELFRQQSNPADLVENA
jgi:hypothetical protein